MSPTPAPMTAPARPPYSAPDRMCEAPPAASVAPSAVVITGGTGGSAASAVSPDADSAARDAAIDSPADAVVATTVRKSPDTSCLRMEAPRCLRPFIQGLSGAAAKQTSGAPRHGVAGVVPEAPAELCARLLRGRAARRPRGLDTCLAHALGHGGRRAAQGRHLGGLRFQRPGLRSETGDPLGPESGGSSMLFARIQEAGGALIVTPLVRELGADAARELREVVGERAR